MPGLRSKPLPKQERGITLAMVALLIVALFAIAAIAVDLGILYTARTSMQHGADAAALAGAFTFLNPLALEPDAAIEAAKVVAGQNKVLGRPIAITSGDVQVDTARRRVTVTVSRTGANGVGTYFARAMGHPLVDVGAHATAEASPWASGTHCIKPFFLPNTILSSKTPDTACQTGEVIFTSSNQLSSFVQNKWGTQMSLRPINPSGALGPSQFYSLQFGAPGAATYQCAIAQCLNSCAAGVDTVRCEDAFPLETGNMDGPTRQGITTLIGSPPDQWIGVGQYETADGTILDDSQSLIVVPVWDDCTQPISSGYHGQTLNVIGFLELFVDGISGQAVQSNLVNASACATTSSGGGGSGGSGNNGTGPMAVPVRLVQTSAQ